MSSINWNTFKEINSFDPNKYGGLQDMGLYINFHDAGLGAYNNNAIYKVGNSYYLVSTGDPSKTINNAKMNNLFKNYDQRANEVGGGLTGSYKTTVSSYPNASIRQITDPNLIAQIEAKGSTSRNGREELAKYNVKSGTVDYDNSFKYSINEDTNNTKTTENVEPTKTNTSSGSGYNPYIAQLERQLNNSNKRLAELEEELHHVYTGDELAEHYGITDTLYSRDYWKNLYTNYVNEMYNDLIKQQDEYRSRFARNNATYDDYLEREYLNSYNNASNARTTRGAIAANALSTGNVNDYNSSKNDISMLQNIYGYEALRQAGLADVDNRAEQAANNNRSILMQYGAKHNTSDVTAATNALNAAATVYGADRNYLTGLANAAKAKYGGLVNAASSNANSSYQQMYDWYMQAYNNDKATASSYLAGLLEGKTGGNS